MHHISRILSCPASTGPAPAWTAIHLCGLPELPRRQARRNSLARATQFLCGLAPEGFSVPAPVARRGGGLLPHPFTLTLSAEAARAVWFLWHSPFPRACHAGPPLARGILACGCPDFPPRAGPGAAVRCMPPVAASSYFPRCSVRYNTRAQVSQVTNRSAFMMSDSTFTGN